MKHLMLRANCFAKTGLSFLLLSLATACTPIGAALGVGATAGVYSQQERGIETAATDSRISLDIFDQWFKYDHVMVAKLSREVHDGRVLVTGVVDKTEKRDAAGALVWKVDGVREVLNETQVVEDFGVLDSAKDGWISTQLETKLLFDRDVRNINYTIETVNGVVYLFGIGRSQKELDVALNHARNIEGVTKVVNHISLPRGTQSAERTAR